MANLTDRQMLAAVCKDLERAPSNHTEHEQRMWRWAERIRAHLTRTDPAVWDGYDQEGYNCGPFCTVAGCWKSVDEWLVMDGYCKKHAAEIEQKRELAKAMFSPIRCGGCDYDSDGTRKYLVGGKQLTEREFKDLVAAKNVRNNL